MFNKKFLRRVIAAALIVGGSNFVPLPQTPIVHAAVQTYWGVGEYVMSDFETPDVAKQRARLRAERAAQEKAGIYLQSYSRMQNFKLLDDEIITMSCGILRVLDIQYESKPIEGGALLWTATLKTAIDSAQFDEWLKRDPQERVELISQNRELQRINAEQEEQIDSLKAQLADASTDDRERLIKKVSDADYVFLSNLKIEDGNKFFAEKNYVGAIKVYDEAIALNPNGATAYDRRGSVRVRLGELSKAMDDFNQALEIDPDFALAYNDRGTARLELGNPSKAIDDLTTALELEPNFAQAYVNRGDAYARLEDYVLAVSDYTRAIGLEPNNADNHSKRAEAYLYSGELEQALDDCNAAIALEPERDSYYVMRAWVRSFLGDASRASVDFDKAIELNPNNSMNYVERGLNLEQMNYFSRAADDFDRAIELDQNNSEAYFNRADLISTFEKNYSRAVEYYTRAIKLDPNYVEAYCNRGAAYHRLKEYRKALADFDRALALKPDCLEAYVNRGVTYKVTDANDKALENFNKALALEEEKAKRLSRPGNYYKPNAAVYHNLALLYQKLGDSEQQRKYAGLASLCGIEYFATDFVTGDGILIPLYKSNF